MAQIFIDIYSSQSRERKEITGMAAMHNTSGRYAQFMR